MNDVNIKSLLKKYELLAKRSYLIKLKRVNNIKKEYARIDELKSKLLNLNKLFTSIKNKKIKNKYISSVNKANNIIKKNIIFRYNMLKKFKNDIDKIIRKIKRIKNQIKNIKMTEGEDIFSKYQKNKFNNFNKYETLAFNYWNMSDQEYEKGNIVKSAILATKSLYYAIIGTLGNNNTYKFVLHSIVTGIILGITTIVFVIGSVVLYATVTYLIDYMILIFHKYIKNPKDKPHKKILSIIERIKKIHKKWKNFLKQVKKDLKNKRIIFVPVHTP